MTSVVQHLRNIF